ncbi:uncharacterized protein LOC126382088 isoform X1 [Pectinophora gossypiella]|uniref:uncharacterized protein LOC126382088 isoform X1 n=2 Tax=Pectinophora gossypiella TaxID=13191 RepID=UPI00214E6AE1|nr:uncharacterized protein LOC126382088 isoform X1 [Pectinophora gossypiella]
MLKKTAVPTRFAWNNYQGVTMKSPKSKAPDKQHKTENNPEVLYHCRVCLIEIRSCPTDMFVPWLHSSFSSTLGEDVTIATHISNIANIEIPEIDGWPKYICTECLNKLSVCLTFINDVRHSEQMLKNKQMDKETDNEEQSNEVTDKTWPKPIQLDKNVSVEIMPFDIEIKQEVISDEELEGKGSDDNRQDCEMLLDIKVEPEEITEQTLPIQVTVNGTISQDQFSSLNGCEDNEKEEWLSSISVKEEPISEDELIPSDMPLECLLCAKTFHTVAGLKAHVITQHSYKTVKRKAENSHTPETKRRSLAEAEKKYFICGICRRNFLTSTDLRVHETCHNKFCCFACNSKFDTFREVTDHRNRCKVKAKAVKPKTLRDAIRERAKTGIEVTSENKKPQCKTCGISFRDALYLRLHNAEQHPNEDATEETISRTEDKNKEDLEVKITIEKCKEDDSKYSKIETELESIFEYAVEKEDSKGSELNDSVYLESREQLEETLGDNGSGIAVEVTDLSVEKLIETNDSQKRLSDQSQEDCEQNETGTIELSNSQIDEPQTSMDKIDINILDANVVVEQSNIEANTNPSDLQVNTNVDKDESIGQIEIEISRMEDNIIEQAANSQEIAKTDLIECIEQNQEARK